MLHMKSIKSYQNFINENTNSNGNEIYDYIKSIKGKNKVRSKDVFLYYKNQYMTKPAKVQIIHIEEYANGEIGSVTIKTVNGGEEQVYKYNFKYLFIEKPVKEDVDMVNEIEEQVYNIVGDSPKQITSLFSFIKDDKSKDIINITFYEEVKDGRTPKFDVKMPLKLKRAVLGYDNFKIKVNGITFNRSESVEGEHNVYVYYYYKAEVEKI